jgi:hypothetical protein
MIGRSGAIFHLKSAPVFTTMLWGLKIAVVEIERAPWETRIESTDFARGCFARHLLLRECHHKSWLCDLPVRAGRLWSAKSLC